MRPPDARPLERLREAGGRIGLREAIVLGDVELARRACDADPALDINGEARFGLHETYLMLAAMLGPPAMVEFLLDRGADIEGIDDLHHTALIRAAEVGNAGVVRLLLDRGADIDRNGPDDSALFMARTHDHQAVAALLLSRGARDAP